MHLQVYSFTDWIPRYTALQYVYTDLQNIYSAYIIISAFYLEVTQL